VQNSPIAVILQNTLSLRIAVYCIFRQGDTAISSFTLKEGDDILLKEETAFVWKDFHQKERKYTLTIGDIRIVRGSGIDSIQVFLNGVLDHC
jgi:hypothetical protein